MRTFLTVVFAPALGLCLAFVTPILAQADRFAAQSSNSYRASKASSGKSATLDDPGWTRYIFFDAATGQVRESPALTITNREGYHLILGGDFMDKLALQTKDYHTAQFAPESTLVLWVDQNKTYVFSEDLNNTTNMLGTTLPKALIEELKQGQTLKARFTLVERGVKITRFNIGSGKELLPNK